MSDDAQLGMVHRLPRARLVERIGYLESVARGRRVIHIGFVDEGFAAMQHEAGSWLHGRLAAVAESLIGLDLDEIGVRAARAAGYEAYVADCSRPEAIAALGLAPAEVVIAGEVIEHVDDPGSFAAGLHGLVAPGGVLVVTTPNASGLLNGAAALVGAEINHPDHVLLFSWRTLTNLFGRHGWIFVDAATFVPRMKQAPARGLGDSLLRWAGRLVLALEWALGRWLAPFVADGLIATFRADEAATGRSSS